MNLTGPGFIIESAAPFAVLAGRLFVGALAFSLFSAQGAILLFLAALFFTIF